jgi:thiol-disulfide isomerase/thioredoxin
MWKRIMAVAAVVAVWVAVQAPAGELSVGDAAPKLEVKEFVKGEPVTGLEKGKTYVVEFWATWCGPCRTSIPHLSELQKKHKDVTFIGVSVYENDQAKVKPFVDEMGEKMTYRVAVDAVPEGGKRNEGKMAKGWMEAAGQNGIPAAFIINKDGHVAWVGHPMEMEKPLQQVLDGTWDIKAAAIAFKEDRARQRKLSELGQKLAKAQRDHDSKAILTILDEAIKDDGKLEETLGLMKYRALAAEADSQDKAVEYGNHLVEKTFKENPQALNALAWIIVGPHLEKSAHPGGKKPEAKKPDVKFVKLALAAAKRADEITLSKDAAIADTLALAYFNDGDTAKALETQERAVKLAEATPGKMDPSMKERLEQYRKAVKKP